MTNKIMSIALRNHSSKFIEQMTSHNELLYHIKRGGAINREPSPMWRMGVR